MPVPASVPPSRNSPGVLAWVAVGSLVLNGILSFWLWQLHRAQNVRLARLEKIVRSAPAPGSGDTTPAPADRANQEDRLAFLLSVAGNPDESKRVLEDVSTGECVAMFRALLARPAAGDRNAALDALARQIAVSDPARAAALLPEVPEATLRSTLTVRITNLWTEQNPADSAQWLDRYGENFLPRDAFDAQLARAVARWSAYDPAAATNFLAARPNPGRETLAALANSAVEWGRKDPTAALSWTQQLPASDTRRFGVTQSILAGWAEHDPQRAATYLQERLYDGGEGSDLYYSTVGLLADRWASGDPVGAAQWAATLPSRRARYDATRRIAAAWAASNLPDAARWASTLSANPARSAAWQAIINAWPGNDLDGESAWVSNLPAGLERDEAVALHAGKIAPADPAKALTLARTIGEPNAQARTLGSILAGWERTDRTAARNWAAANDLDLPPPTR